MSKRIIEIEIGCCGDCPYYDYKKHRCRKGAMDEGEPTDSFYADCPLNYREKRTSNKQIEGKVFTDVDILANDLNQHCADLAENYCGDIHCVTCLAHALTQKGYRKASDVARETVKAIKDEVSKKEVWVSEFYDCRYGGYVIRTTDLEDIIRRYIFDTYEEAELKKKYESEVEG